MTQCEQRQESVTKYTKQLWLVILGVSLVLLCGCQKSDAEPLAAEPNNDSAKNAIDVDTISSTSSSTSPTTDRQIIDSSGEIESSVQPPAEVLAQRLRTENFVNVKKVSSRSRSVRLIFKDGSSALFKPLLKGDSSGRLEVAYYRLAQLLGVSGVPVSVMRPIYPSRLESALRSDGEAAADAFFEAVERDEKGRVWGAMIQWLDGLAPLGIEDSKGKVNAADLFQNESLITFRGAFSKMIMLDFLLSNWDRFSGGNLFLQTNENQPALIDHNEAFYNLSDRQREKLDSYLAATPCFSSDFLRKVHSLTKEKIDSAVSVEEWQRSLLKKEEVSNILKRKQELVAFVLRKRADTNDDAGIACE